MEKYITSYDRIILLKNLVEIDEDEYLDKNSINDNTYWASELFDDYDSAKEALKKELKQKIEHLQATLDGLLNE